MHRPLLDITDRIAEPPKWWIDGIPRYCEYHPKLAIGSFSILIRVSCETCGHHFDVAFGANKKLGGGLVDLETGFLVVDAFPNPPFHLGSNGFNCAGNHNGVIPIAVLQAWEARGRTWAPDWERRADLEGSTLADM